MQLLFGQSVDHGNSPYLIKPKIMISPKTPSREALLQVLVRLLARARQSEIGIIKGNDAEFLHSYRVSLRKLRSLLAVMKGVFPIEKTMEWRKKLADFCRATNELRDLDVYFLSRKKLEKLLPAILRPEVEVLFKDLAKARRKQALKVSAFMKSAKYRAEMANIKSQWRDDLNLEPTANFKFPISRVAGKVVAKCFRRIRKLYSHLNKETPDDTIHRVRIECKKMRYLLESFSGLFPDLDLAAMSRQLARLQTRLGRYNDTSIQQAYLLAEAQNQLHPRNVHLTLTLGCLIGGLHHEHAIFKKKVFDAIKSFCSRENANLAKALEK
jgi:CHAD domain-containing protein